MDLQSNYKFVSGYAISNHICMWPYISHGIQKDLTDNVIRIVKLMCNSVRFGGNQSKCVKCTLNSSKI